MNVTLTGGTLAQPVTAELTIDGATHVATEPQTGIFGCGPTLCAALRDFRSALNEWLDALEDLDDEEIHHLYDTREHLRKHLVSR